MQTKKNPLTPKNLMQMILYHWEENFNTWYDYTITLALKPIMLELDHTVPSSDIYMYIIYIVKSHTVTINRKAIKSPVLTPMLPTKPCARVHDLMCRQ